MQRLRPTTPRGRFMAAAAVGGVAAVIVFAWFALEGRPALFDSEPFAHFYEVQARSWLHGQWDAPKGAYLFERFNVDGRFYTYFGPFPALLRLPFVAVTDSLDGALSRMFMILAFALMLWFTARLAWQVRSLVRGDGPPTRRTLLAVGGFVFVAGCGSTALFLGSATWVYHEAILWGLAWAIVSFSFLLEYLVTGRGRALAWASAAATFSYLSRGSVGLGPVAALALVLLARVLVVAVLAARRRKGTNSEEAPWFLRWLGLGDVERNRSIGPVAVALLVPVALYMYVNVVKFGTLFGTPPYHLQDLLAARPGRQAALAANGGSLFGVKYAPTLLLEYFRPDAIGLDRLFPWVTFAPPPRVIGDAVFESLNFSASVPSTSTLLFLLSICGVIGVVRIRRAGGTAPDGGATEPAPPVRADVLRVPILGALAGCVGTFVLAFLDERYQGDFVPVLVLAGVVGLWFTARWIDGRSRAVHRVVGVALVVLAAWSCWVVFSLTLLQQRAYGPLTSTSTRAQFLAFQVDVHEVVPGGGPSDVTFGDLPLPAPAPAGTFYVAGECAGLYWSDGRFWQPVEATNRTGQFRLRVHTEDLAAQAREPVLGASDDRGTSALWLRRLDDGRARFEYEWTGKDQTLIEGVTPDEELGDRTGPEFAVPADGIVSITVRMDPAGYVSVRDRDAVLLSTIAPVAEEPADVGTQPDPDIGATVFTGTIDSRGVPTPLCDRLVRLDRDDARRAGGAQ